MMYQLELVLAMKGHKTTNYNGCRNRLTLLSGKGSLGSGAARGPQ